MKLGLNIGSGQRPFPDAEGITWINVDKVPHGGMPMPDLLCDGAHLPHSNGSVDYFVLHHVLEHFGCGEAKGLIDEAFRVLRPGGSLLVFVPNMRALAAHWLGGGIDTQVFMTNVYGAYMGHEEDRHKWGYDPTSLSLFMVGDRNWKDIDHFDWREVPGMDVARDWWILALEAVR